MSAELPIKRPGRPRKHSEGVKKRIVELWSDGVELSQIVAKVNEEFKVSITLDDVFRALKEMGVSMKTDEEIGENVEDVFNWLFHWQLDRLKMYKMLEKQTGVPIPDVRSNISLMLMLLERRAKAVDMAQIREFLGKYVERGEDENQV